MLSWGSSASTQQKLYMILIHVQQLLNNEYQFNTVR